MMNALPGSTDSMLWKIFFTPVGPRLVVGRRLSLRRWLPRRWSAGEMIAASTLPAEVTALIVEVVRRTRLWRREKVDVARELIAHFEDAIKSEADPVQALRDFGEAKQAAKLIRRAKKRSRPIIWHAWRRTLHASAAALCLSVALYGVLIVRYFSGSPVIARDYTAEVNATIVAVPEEQRAWPLYREALLALEVSPLPAFEVNQWVVLPADAPQWVDAERVLRKLGATLELIRRGARRPRLGFSITIDIDWDVERRFESLSISGASDSLAETYSQTRPVFERNSGRHSYIACIPELVEADARLSLLDKDAERLTADLIALVGIADQYANEPLFIDSIFSLNLLGASTRLIGETLARSRDMLTSDQLVALAHRLSAFADGGPIEMRFGVWRIYFADFVQRLYTDDGRGDGRLTPEGLRLLRSMGPTVALMGEWSEPSRLDGLAAPLAAQLIAGRREVEEEFERQLSLMEREAAQPMRQWKEIPGTSFENLLASPAYYRRYQPLFVMLPAVGHAAMMAESATQRRDAALTAIALELFRRRHGAYPAQLEELVPNFLPTVPIDRFDGRPLRYRLTDDGPLLYSVGADHIDDGGTAPETDEDRWRVARYRFKIPADPMKADWILWDGRAARSAAGEP